MQKKKIIIGVCAVLLIAAGIFFLTTNNKQVVSLTLSPDEQKIANVYAGVYGVPLERVMEIKAENDSWDAVNEQLVKEKYMISEADKTRLHEEGYDLLDLYEADKLAYRTRGNAYDIIRERGKGEDVRKWSEVEQKLNLDTRSEAEKAGLSKAQINELKNKKYSESDIMRIAFLMYSSKNTYEEMMKALKQEKSIDVLEQRIKEKMGVKTDE